LLILFFRDLLRPKSLVFGFSSTVKARITAPDFQVDGTLKFLRCAASAIHTM